MDSPNRNANTATGTQMVIDPVAGTPQMALEPWPRCHTNTMIP